MVSTYAFEFGSTGRRSLGVFQTLLAGKTAQPLSVWPRAFGLAAQTSASPTIAKSVRRSTQPPWKVLHSSVGTSALSIAYCGGSSKTVEGSFLGFGPLG